MFFCSPGDEGWSLAVLEHTQSAEPDPDEEGLSQTVQIKLPTARLEMVGRSLAVLASLGFLSLHRG